MKNIFKKLFIPSEDKQEVIAYKSWIVRWYSVMTDYDSSTYAYRKQQSEIFPSEIDANKFAEQLIEASKLLKCDKRTFLVTVEENQSKLATVK